MLVLTQKRVVRASIVIALVLALSIIGALPITQTMTEKLPEFARALVVGIAGTAEAADADYICDGTADDVQIQAAIDDLPSGGGKVLLLAGTYSIGSQIDLVDDLTLQGVGFATILKIEDNYDANFKILEASSKSNIVICDMTIDGNKDNQSSGWMYGIQLTSVSDILVEDVEIKNLRHVGIRGETSGDRVIIQNCIFHDNGWHGVWLSNGDHSAIENNIFYSNGRNGISVGESTNNDWDNGIISENIIYLNGWRGIIVDGNSTACQILNNIVLENSQETDAAHDGILIYNTAHYNIIAGNIVRMGGLANKHRWGINLYTTTYNNYVHGNDLYDSGSTSPYDLNDQGSNNKKRDNIAYDGTMMTDS